MTDAPAALETDVAIVGAGFAGLGLGILLKRSGRESFVLLERADEVGGTWRDNVYPGVACDIPSHLYSFSFRPKPDWSRVFAGGAEIQEYLREAAHAECLLPHLRFGAELETAAWNADAGRWFLTTAAGPVSARVLVLAAGRLSEPRVPTLPGLDAFPGPVFHSARWDAAADLTGRIGVAGTGASAVQLVPALAKTAASVTLFQRSAAWIVPRQDRAYTAEERAAFARQPETAEALRAEIFADAERGILARRGDAGALAALRARALEHLAAQVPEAALRAHLTPDYEIGCKRVLLSDDFYPALARHDVALVSSALMRLEGRTAVAADGSRHELDALVLATGFVSTRQPYAERITGAGGIRLAEHWAAGMTSHASIAVAGFPNAFILDGPNASLGHNSAIAMIEAQLEHVLGALAHLEARPGLAIEATTEAEEAYTRLIDERARPTVWLTGGCRSWYVDERSGRLTLLWPDSAEAFRERNGVFDAVGYRDLEPVAP